MQQLQRSTTYHLSGWETTAATMTIPEEELIFPALLTCSWQRPQMAAHEQDPHRD